MNRKTVSAIMLTLLLVSVLSLTSNIQPARASGTIYIKADGSIDPPTAPISTTDNITYTFTDNIYDKIVVERDNIVVDGTGYTVQGTGEGRGLRLSQRSNVTIKNVRIEAFTWGIHLRESSNNTISGNNITNNWRGVELYLGSSNTISGNNITNNNHGIYIDWSSNNTLRNNDANNNKHDFYVFGTLLSDYIQDIDESNTVNGKPVYYWVGRRDSAVPLDAGWIALVNCTRMTVQNLNFTNSGSGVLLVFTTNSTITGNNIESNFDSILLRLSSNNVVCGNNITASNFGIMLDYSSHNNTVSRNNITASNSSGIMLGMASNNTVYGNDIENNWEGILLLSSSNNKVSGNLITGNNYSGISLGKHANYNKISENNVTNNAIYGIYLSQSSNNSIYHNNFIDNPEQVYSPNEATNVWDNGYPSGGNYWDDFNGTDLHLGPSQSIIGSDGIGDTPYIIDEENQDNYPLMKPCASGTILVAVYTDKLVYHAGDIMRLGLNATNPDSVKYVCGQIILELPDGSTHTLVHRHSVILPIGWEYKNPSYRIMTLPNLPLGTYKWHALVLDRATHTIIVHDTAEWEFSK